jgi:LysR family cyn operon transcriptional activator
VKLDEDPASPGRSAPSRAHGLDLNKLATFFAVAEAGGVSAAARRLGVTRSAVSQSLAGLEAGLALDLFHRVGRRLVPTREGALLRERFAGYQRELERTLTELADREREVRGSVRVGLFLGFSRLRLGRLVASFLDAHPHARVRVRYGSRREIEEALLGGRIDFAFSLEAWRRRPVRSTRLLRQELVLVGAPVLVRGRIDPARLARLPVVDYFPGEPLIDRWLRHHFGRRAPRPSVRVWAGTTDLVLELTLRQVGVAVLPRDLAAPWVRERRLGIVETGRPQLLDSVWLGQLPNRHPSPRLTAFRDVVLEEFRGD